MTCLLIVKRKCWFWEVSGRQPQIYRQVFIVYRESALTLLSPVKWLEVLPAPLPHPHLTVPASFLSSLLAQCCNLVMVRAQRVYFLFGRFKFFLSTLSWHSNVLCIFGLSCKPTPCQRRRSGFPTIKHDPVPLKERNSFCTWWWFCSIVAKHSGSHSKAKDVENGKYRVRLVEHLHGDSLSSYYLLVFSQLSSMNIFISIEK